MGGGGSPGLETRLDASRTCFRGGGRVRVVVVTVSCFVRSPAISNH
jgi:hypothetical protein